MPILISTIVIALLAILSTNVLGILAIAGVKPDLVLIVLVFNGYKNGVMQGQISGFVGGAVEDLLSTAPLGFHALIRTLLGGASGLPRNRLYLDPILLPALLIFIATLGKGVLAAGIGVIFGVEELYPRLFTGPFFIEAGYNALIAPILYSLVNMFAPMNNAGREGPS